MLAEKILSARQEGRVQAERLVRELQEKLGRATAKNATMAEGMVSAKWFVVTAVHSATVSRLTWLLPV